MNMSLAYEAVVLLAAAVFNEAVHRFRQHDEALLERQHKIYHDEARPIAAARQGAEELERLFEEDISGSAK